MRGDHESRDTSYVGPAVANTIRECDGMVDALSFWTFSDVFEEGGPIPEPFEGHFGLRAEGGINKPSFYDFPLLHRLGDTRISNPNTHAIVTRRSDGGLAIAVWNIVDPGETGSTQRVQLLFKNVPAGTPVSISRVDNEHGNTLAAYKQMGSPRYPTEQQIEQLNEATKLPPPEHRQLTGGKLDLDLDPNALVLIETSQHD